MKNKKINFLTIAKYILLFVILTIYPMSSLYARYVSKNSSTQSAVVAKFDVNEYFSAEQSFPISIKPGENVSRDIIINNNSDVAVNVTIVVENVTNNLPLIFLDADEEIPPHTTEVVSINVIWNENDNSYEYAEMVDVIKLLITAQQVD